MTTTIASGADVITIDKDVALTFSDRSRIRICNAILRTLDALAAVLEVPRPAGMPKKPTLKQFESGGWLEVYEDKIEETIWHINPDRGGYRRDLIQYFIGYFWNTGCDTTGPEFAAHVWEKVLAGRGRGA